MTEPLYHVVLEGRTVGPYDRRTIVGMRIKNALTSQHALLGSDGSRLSVADLVKRRPQTAFQPNRTTSHSLVQATFTASVLRVQGEPAITAIPRFKGEVEARVQTDVLRIAGRFRQGLGWKEDRVKLALADIVHARVRGSVVDLWMRRTGHHELCRIALELFTPEAAGEFVDWLPNATAWPQVDSVPGELGGAPPRRWLKWLSSRSP